jgi:hypothetical protein
MKLMHQRKSYRLEDLVIAAYNAAQEVTSDPLLAARIATRVLEDWFMRSDGKKLMIQLQLAFL